MYRRRISKNILMESGVSRKLIENGRIFLRLAISATAGRGSGRRPAVARPKRGRRVPGVQLRGAPR